MPIIAAVGLLTAFASLSAFLGGWYWAFDLLANFRPQIAVVGSILGLLLLLGRWRRTGMVVLASSMVSVVLVGWLWLPAAPSESSGTPLRVATFNLLSTNEEYEAVIGWLRSIEADVVFLQEASLPWEEALVAADLAYRVEVTRDPDLIFGTLVLVRDETAGVRGFGFETDQPRAAEVLLPLEDGSVTVLGIHPLSPTSEDRSDLRSAQFDWALDRMQDVGAPVVLAGDFNASRWAYPFRRLLAAGLRDSMAGFGLQTTFPALANPIFRVAIDHVLVSDGVEVIDRQVGPPLGSDHLPVIVDLRVSTAS